MIKFLHDLHFSLDWLSPIRLLKFRLLVDFDRYFLVQRSMQAKTHHCIRTLTYTLTDKVVVKILNRAVLSAEFLLIWLSLLEVFENLVLGMPFFFFPLRTYFVLRRSWASSTLLGGGWLWLRSSDGGFWLGGSLSLFFGRGQVFVLLHVIRSYLADVSAGDRSFIVIWMKLLCYLSVIGGLLGDFLWFFCLICAVPWLANGIVLLRSQLFCDFFIWLGVVALCQNSLLLGERLTEGSGALTCKLLLLIWEKVVRRHIASATAYYLWCETLGSTFELEEIVDLLSILLVAGGTLFRHLGVTSFALPWNGPIRT